MAECEALDMKIAKKMAESECPLDDTEFDQYVQRLREANQHDKAAQNLREEAEKVQDHLRLQIAILGIQLTENNTNAYLAQLMHQAQQLVMQAEHEV